jgi:dTDP-4-amino-4,6-dideoxygalactose transaminase
MAGILNVAYDRVFNSSQYIGGKEVEAFENEWAEYCEAKYCVGVGNGHDALMLACKYYADNREDPDIFVPWKTCLPSWSAARNSGFYPSPIFRGQSYMMAVHIYGQINIPKTKTELKEYWDRLLIDLAGKIKVPEKIVLIEDCAQAHGAKLNGIKAGKFGEVACWSFYPTKNLGALGDAGAVTTDNLEIADFVREIRNYGVPNYPGVNSRLDPLQAAFLRARLPYLDKWNEQRTDNASTYLSNIVPDSKVTLPKLNGETDEPCWHIFAIETDERDDLKNYLARNGVETMIHYPKVPYPSYWKIPEAERWTKRTLSLPVAPHVSPYICKQIAMLINEWMEK